MGQENRIPLTDGARGFALLDTSSTLSSDSDWRVPSQKAVNTVTKTIISDTGMAAAAYIDFNDVGEAEMSVVVGGVSYTEVAPFSDVEGSEEDGPIPAVGTWTNGSDAGDSADSLIAAINGDTRADVPFTAVADLSGDGVWLFWDEVGVDGVVDITTDSSANCTVSASSFNGADAAKKQQLSFTHTVAAQDLLSGGIEFPLPFTPGYISVLAYTATGAPVYYTDLVTVETEPTRLRIETDGATNIAATNVIHVLVSD